MPSEALTGPAPHILVVDDDQGVRDILAEYLAYRGYGVLQAGTGAEALARLATHPTLRLMISDVRMPGLSGIELAERTTAEYPNLRVILMSAYFQAQVFGARFLKKPFSMVQLAALVQAELHPQRLA